MAKRGAKVSRQVVFSAIAIVVLVGALIVYTAVVREPGLSEEEKAILREQCAKSYQDKMYFFTTLAECETGGFDAARLRECKAWVSEDLEYCEFRGRHTDEWCLAKATRDPEECEALVEGEAGYCKAYVAKDGSLCAAIEDEGYQEFCDLTLNNDLNVVLNDVADMCGEELVANP